MFLSMQKLYLHVKADSVTIPRPISGCGVQAAKGGTTVYVQRCHQGLLQLLTFFVIAAVSKLQVAVLAPLALLLVLEARCTHFVIAHFINIVCCGVVHPSLFPHSTYIL